ncbi:dynamin family protein [Frigoriflavimonas asaccharolytica]|uniref:Molybdopterin-guanine dinucleotide biosynthesis protein/uncharacterized protein YlxW (UPF0749 family) n=1 Tax=Frigoriflavimonas asaccharolytica TaxID=2735899 RepID=A0A8J8K9F3_9FLAO|nr:dynamin family protein [Frigoriflavimonas asaccharolytica]NRS93556.1 molybdopterin-guanine dinucleotide biosynthesis protein/uncharacterized protein YlxW (UPF0749 family) [Frigoriflavimonas asaccharolytica]
METATWFFVITTIIAVIGIIVIYLQKNKEKTEQNQDSKQENKNQIILLNTQIHELKNQLNDKDNKFENVISIPIEKEKNVNPANNDFLTEESKLPATDEILSLTNQLALLKQEYEELQSDLENSENKSSRKRKELNSKITEFEQEKDDFETKIKDLNSQHEETIASLDENSIELNKALNKALINIENANSFLNAKEHDNQHKLKFYKSVENIENFVEKQLLPKLQSFNEFEEGEQSKYNELIWTWANLQRKSWLQSKKVIAFVGEFSAGKTSIINKILTHDNHDSLNLPVSSKATTAIPTYISYDENLFCQFTDNNGVLKNINQEVFENVKKDLFSQISLSSLIQYFVISYKNENLKDISILDTPGFNSTDVEDTQRTADVIRESDALFWVFDANLGDINETSIEAIKKYLTEIPIYIIINKADTKSSAELADIEKQIRQTLEKNSIAIKNCLLFSQNGTINEQKEYIKNLFKKIGEIPNISKIDELDLIYRKLDEEILEATNQSVIEKKKNKLFKNELSIVEDQIDMYFKSIKYSSEKILEKGKKENKWLGKDYYKMTEDERNELEDEIKTLNESGKKISELHTEIKDRELIEEIERSVSKFNAELNQRKELRKLKGELNTLVEDWDPKYHSRLK